MATPQLQFNSYTLPRTFYVSERPTNRNVPNAKLPRADGARTITGYLDEKRFSVKGYLIGGYEIIPTGNADLRTQLDTLKAALNGGPSTFTMSSDRYWRNCQVANFKEDYDPTGQGRFCDIDFDILTGDPFQYDTTNQTATHSVSSSPTTWTVTAGGNAYALPQISVTMSSTGTVDALLTNNTNGQVMRLQGAVTSGDVIKADSLLQVVTLVSSGANKISLFDGIFPALVVGGNSFTLTYSGVTISSVAMAWNNRYF
jgi:hypothetical protein